MHGNMLPLQFYIHTEAGMLHFILPSHQPSTCVLLMRLMLLPDDLIVK